MKLLWHKHILYTTIIHYLYISSNFVVKVIIEITSELNFDVSLIHLLICLVPCVYMDLNHL